MYLWVNFINFNVPVLGVKNLLLTPIEVKSVFQDDSWKEYFKELLSYIGMLPIAFSNSIHVVAILVAEIKIIQYY